MRTTLAALGLSLVALNVSAQTQTTPPATPPPATQQTTTGGGTAPPPAPATKTETPKQPAFMVTGLSLPAEQTATPAEAKKAADEAKRPLPKTNLGGSIVLTTSPGLATFLDDAMKQKKAVTLYLDGNDTLIEPEGIDRDNNRLQFRLERNSDNKKIWASLLRDPFHHSIRRVEASIGMSGSPSVPAEKSSFDLAVVRWEWWAWAWLAALVLLLVLFGWLVRKRDMLRDGPKPCPYSLGRCQMAWWFFLIIVSYVVIWLISGDQDTITASLLGLMGISAGTALGSVMIDSAGGDGALTQAATDRTALLAAQDNAEKTLAAAQAAADAAPADAGVQKNLADAKAAKAVVDSKLTVVNNQINNVAKVVETRGFFRDLVSDSNGTVGLHRFQIVVWTAVLGVIFMVSVLTKLNMPEFSATLLATMGISAGTYLGFKFPEK
jgi:hypothetical protein